MVVIPFTRDLSMMPPFEFAEEMLFSRLHAIEVHEGFNFRFGHKAEGDVERLGEFGSKLGFTVVTHTPIRWGELVISSSNVRAVVLGGKVDDGAASAGAGVQHRFHAGARPRIRHEIHGSDGEPGALR